MACIPRREADVKALARKVIRGMQEHPDIFPNPPVPPAELQARLDAFDKASDDEFLSRLILNATENGSEALHADVQRSIKRYVNEHQTDVREAPGQPRTVEAALRSNGRVFIDWKEPIDGGAVALYKIERRERPAGPWMIVGVSIETETTLLEQEKAKPWEFRVVAVNKAGESIPSNTVDVKL